MTTVTAMAMTATTAIVIYTVTAIVTIKFTIMAIDIAMVMGLARMPTLHSPCITSKRSLWSMQWICTGTQLAMTPATSSYPNAHPRPLVCQVMVMGLKATQLLQGSSRLLHILWTISTTSKDSDDSRLESQIL